MSEQPDKKKKTTRKRATTGSKAKKSSKPVEVRSSGQAKDSPYVVNLRNPQGELVMEKQNFISQPPSRLPSIPPPPRKGIGKSEFQKGVNFIPKKKLWGAAFASSKSSRPEEPPAKKPEPNPALGQVEDLVEVDHVLHETVTSAVNSIENIIPDEIEDVFAPQAGVKPKRPPKIKPIRERANTGRARPRVFLKPVLVFAIVCIVLVLPLRAFTYFQQLQATKDQVFGMTHEAISQLLAGRDAVTQLDLVMAVTNFQTARQQFADAQLVVDGASASVAEIIRFLPGYGKTLTAGSVLLKSGEQFSEIGQLLSQSAERLFHGGDISDYYYSFVELDASLSAAMGIFREVETNLSALSPTDIPQAQRELFVDVVAALPMIKEGFVQLHEMSTALLTVLGHDQWQRYLLVFVNTNELRGGGGFMGTFGVLDIDRGQIKNLFIPAGGTYDVQGQLKPRVLSPEPFHLINPRWEFQDSNWWPDFPTTAQKMQWFYENSWAQSVDGTIVLSSTLLERLLDVIGPIQMSEYGVTITSENFVAETQQIIKENNIEDEPRPKQFLADLAPRLMDALFGVTAEQMPELLEHLQAGLNQKQMLLYFNDQDVEQVIDRLGWNGEVKQTLGDYLMVVHTNLAGGKTDGVIDETIRHQVEVQPDRSLIVTVDLERTHNGIRGENIFTGVQNNSYVRFYVPAGSELLSATGFERPAENFFKKPTEDLAADQDWLKHEQNHRQDNISNTDVYEESGKTVFGNWLQLPAETTRTASIRYRLPFRLEPGTDEPSFYSFLAQKQHGSRGSRLESSLILPAGIKAAATFPTGLPHDDAKLEYQTELTTDQFYGVILDLQS